MSRHKTYREIRQTFPPEMQQRISAGADKIRQQLKILNTVRQAAGLTEVELEELLGMPEFSNLQNNSFTFGTLISTIVTMGGSIDITVNFPEKPPVQFEQIEVSFPDFTTGAPAPKGGIANKAFLKLDPKL
jgi:hypothetical protein